MRAAYPSDITRDQFDMIRHRFATARKETRPREYDLYGIFCAVLYILKEGSRWRSLPYDFPKWGNVYYRYQIWKKEDEKGKGILDKAQDERMKSERIIKGREPEPAMTIVDSRSVKNAFTAGEKGYEGGKKNLRKKSRSGG